MKTLRLFLRLLRLVYPLCGIMVFAVLMGVLGFLSAIGIPVLGTAVLLKMSGYSISLSYSTFWMLLFVFALMRGIFRYIEQACNHYIAFKLLALLRDHLFSKLRMLSPAKLEGKNKGDLISLITSDIELLEVFYAHTISPVCIAFFICLLFVLYFAKIHWIIACWAMLAYALIGVAYPLFFSQNTRVAGFMYRQEASHLNSFVLESMRGLQESIQYEDSQSRLEGLQNYTFRLNLEEKRLKSQQARTTALINASVVIFSFVMLILGKVVHLSIPEQAMSSVLLFSSFGPVIALANLGTSLSQTIGAGQRLCAILDEEPMVEEVKDGTNVDFDHTNVDSIDFSYGYDNILQDFSLSTHRGEVLGIQGKSGCGKSTLLKLLMRFWDPNHGFISVDGQNLATIDTSCLRKHEGYVTQETVLFHDTIENNLRIACMNASMDDLIDACKKANIHEEILSFPKGYQTVIGELGSTLSGGQRQRIGLARMFLHKSDFLLLDEPTSNLDSLNESMILRSIDQEKARKTIVFVSHRKSTLKHCDRLISMESKRQS